MSVKVTGANAHNLNAVDAVFGDGLTAVTRVSGSGKSSIVFDTLQHEAQRHFATLFSTGSGGAAAPADVARIDGLSPTIAIGQDLLNCNPESTVATFTGIHPFLRLALQLVYRRASPTP